MNRYLLTTSLLLGLYSFIAPNAGKTYIARQGQVTFFSYTTVENIQATNNTVQSVIDVETNDIAVSMLMKAFVFDKSLMQSHFNESYIESDRYPKSTFVGKIIDLDADFEGIQTRIIKGDFTMRNITKPMEIKAQVSNNGSEIIINGETTLLVDDFMINIPPVLKQNISKNIKVSFNLVHKPNEK